MTHLTKEQRYTIFSMKQQNYKHSDIALVIGKDKSVVSRELRRNCDMRNNKYNPELAQQKAEKRLAKKNKKKHFTPEIEKYVKNLINEDFSPEQIVGRAVVEDKPCVSHERIYQYIWADKKEGGDLHTHLRRQGRKYRKRSAAKDSRGIIKNRRDISERPEIVDKKERIGDLEIDTMIGQNHKGALLTINDRISGYVWIEKLEGKNAEKLAEKTKEALLNFKDILHTITADNGKEFAAHEKISKDLGVDFYFARPYHSWERGANENTNGLIRQYFPKKTSLENITNQEVKEVQNKLNNRPRKKLGFLTPIEFLSLKLPKEKVAFVT